MCRTGLAELLATGEHARRRFLAAGFWATVEQVKPTFFSAVPTIYALLASRPGPDVLRGGWLHTGDVGRFDDDGYLTLVDRVKDLIIRGGENIYPKEIEDVLHAHPAVLEAAVVGQPDPVFGEQPVAFVTLRPGHTAAPEDLIEHCRPSLARYKVPRAACIEETLPKNAIGKIAKPVLRQRLRQQDPAQGTHP